MTVRRSPRVVSQRLAGAQGAVLLHLDTSGYYSLNEVGAFIWDSLSEPVELQQLRDRVAARFADAPGPPAGDVDEFLAELAERGLIGIEPVSAAEC